MKKRILAIALASLLCLALMAGCNNNNTTSPTPGSNAGPVTIRVAGMFGGSDANKENFDEAVAKYEAETGNTVQNEAATADDAWKARILSDFELGSDPDIVQFFTGADGNALVENNKIVSIDEIRAVYPDFASNINDGALANVASPVDGKSYGVPTNGYWEGTFYNKAMLKEVGWDSFPTDWNDFLALCDALVAAGKTPIAESLSAEPNYTFEFLLYNLVGSDLPNVTPKAKGDDAYNAYIKVLENFKMFTDKGYYPGNVFSIDRGEAVQLVADGKAAILFGGHWNRGGLEDQAATDDIELSGFPTEDSSIRDAISFVGGYSSGFMISRKAWDDPAKRQACVDFIKYVTSDEAVTKYAGASSSPLKTPGTLEESTPLLERCRAIIASGKGVAAAVEDTWTTEAKLGLYTNDIALYCAGQMTAEQVLDNFMANN